MRGVPGCHGRRRGVCQAATEGGAGCARLPGKLEGDPRGKKYTVVNMTLGPGGSE